MRICMSYTHKKEVIYMIKKISIAILIVLFLAAAVYAGGDRRKGTAGAQELRIPLGSRGAALGGSFVSSVTGIESIYWNPAGLSSVRNVEALFSYMDYIADMKFIFSGVGVSIPGFGTLGISGRVLSVGDIIVTTEEAPDGTGEILTPNFVTLGVTYSRQMTDRVFFGSSINFVTEQIDRESARGWCMDFGFQYIPGLVRGLKIGVAVKNIGPNMRFSGADLEHLSPVPGTPVGSEQKLMRTYLSSFELPSYFHIGTSLDLVNNETMKATVTASFKNNNFIEDEYNGGVEFAYKDMLFLRGGYITSQQSDYLYGATFGAGLKLNMGTQNLFFDYSWGQTNEFFSHNQWLSVRYAF